MPSVDRAEVLTLSSVASDNVWAVGMSGVTDRWNGSTWTSGTASTNADLNAVWGTGANDVWAVGQGGTIFSILSSTSKVPAGKRELVMHIEGVVPDTLRAELMKSWSGVAVETD